MRREGAPCRLAHRARPARRRGVAEGFGFVGFVVERSFCFVADDFPGIGDGPEARRVAAPVGVVLLGEAEVGLLRLGSCCCWTYAERRVGVRAEAPPRHSSPEAVDEGACAQHRRDGGCGAAVCAVAIPLCMRSVIIYRNLSISLFLTNNEPTAPNAAFCLPC